MNARLLIPKPTKPLTLKPPNPLPRPCLSVPDLIPKHSLERGAAAPADGEVACLQHGPLACEAI